MDEYTEPKDAKRFIWGDPKASGRLMNEDGDDHYSEPYICAPGSSDKTTKATAMAGNDSEDVYHLAASPDSMKTTSDYDVPPPPVSADQYNCLTLNGGTQTRSADPRQSVSKVEEQSEDSYSHTSTWSNKKTAQPTTTGTNNSSKNSTEASAPTKHSPAKSTTQSPPEQQVSRQKVVTPKKKGGGMNAATSPGSGTGSSHSPSPPVYEEAWDTARQQKKLEDNLRLARSISTTSDKFEDALEYLPEDWAPMRQKNSGRKAGGKTTDPVSGGTYEEAWDLNRGLEEKLRSLQFMHPEPSAGGGGAEDSNYQEPWDTAKKQRELEKKILQARTSGVVGGQKSPQPSQRQQQRHSQQQVHQPRQSQEDVYEEAWDTKRGLSQILQESRNSSPGSTRSTSSVHCTIGEPVNAMIPLQNQDWYHGNISRDDAEQQLRVSKHGSYLVRDSSDRYHYTLSIKGPQQIIHIQIDQCKKADSTMRYILGKNSKAFHTIPAMIDHYTQHAMPIKGAEHMTLLHPIQCHWSQAGDDTRL